MDKMGRIVISVVVLFILLVSISSYFVLATETNTKSYDSMTRTVTVSKSGTEIAKVKLDTPLVNYVIRGKDRLVAQFTINNFDVYTGGVLDKVDFYNLNDNSKIMSRDFTWKYRVITGTRTIPEYKEVCKGEKRY